MVGGFPDPLRDQLMDLLFDHKTGLGIEICRYNIGGSGPWPGNRDTKNFRYGADLPRYSMTILPVEVGLSRIVALLPVPTNLKVLQR